MRELVVAEIERMARLREQSARVARVSKRALRDGETWQEQVDRETAEANELRGIAAELTTEVTENTEGDRK